MRYEVFCTPVKLHTAIFIKSSALKKKQIQDYYITPCCSSSVYEADAFVACELAYQANNKAPAALKKEHLDNLMPQVKKHGIKTIIVADADYFKYMAKVNKADPYYGYVLPCAIPGYEEIQLILAPNYQSVFYNPLMRSKLKLAMETACKQVAGKYSQLGENIFQHAEYPKGAYGIRRATKKLLKHPELVCDIETESLDFYNAGLSTIGFAWNKCEGVAFPVDRAKRRLPQKARKYLRNFFENYEGKLIFHNAGYDMKVLVYELWMKDLGDYQGMLRGIEVMTRNFDDTKIISYLATNSTAKHPLGLKQLAHEYAGNYAMDDDIEDTANIDLDDLLRYNLTDCLATWYVHDKYYPVMQAEGQEDLYKNLFKPIIKSLLQTELCGMPVDYNRVLEVEKILKGTVQKHIDAIHNSKLVQDCHYTALCELAEQKTAAAKKKVYTVADPVIWANVFNPNSGKQLRKLIYEYLGYDVIDTTKTGLPATGYRTLEKLINHSKHPEHTEIFENLIGLTKATKILTDFIPSFLNAQRLPDGSYRLYGNFNLGGTQSGRLSSSNPNLQNIPSGSTYAELIKSCFISPPGWIFCGADFTALEAMANALLTRDPNRLKVYTEGYDSHCLNAYAYFKDEMPDIQDTVDSINSIKKKYKKLRSKSKAPTFALQYEGIVITLMRSLGIDQETAQQIYDNYHALYVESDKWLDSKMNQAAKDGFVTCAFGLKLRTPVMACTVAGSRLTPYVATKERRSAGNAITQSYGLLNSRAAKEFQERCLASPYKYDILPVAQIHDAIYLLVRNDIDIVHWVNQNLIECMEWQELEEIKHDQVKIGANLDLYWPTWKDALELPNNASELEIRRLCKEHYNKNK